MSHELYRLIHQAAQHSSTGGRIIAFSSSVLTKSFPTYGPYIVSKAISLKTQKGEAAMKYIILITGRQVDLAR